MEQTDQPLKRHSPGGDENAQTEADMARRRLDAQRASLARKSAAQRAYAEALGAQALEEMLAAGERLTLSTVADRAGVSRAVLAKTKLADKIRDLALTTPAAGLNAPARPSPQATQRDLVVRRALEALVRLGRPVSVEAVARRSGLSQSTVRSSGVAAEIRTLHAARREALAANRVRAVRRPPRDAVSASGVPQATPPVSEDSLELAIQALQARGAKVSISSVAREAGVTWRQVERSQLSGRIRVLSGPLGGAAPKQVAGRRAARDARVNQAAKALAAQGSPVTVRAVMSLTGLTRRTVLASDAGAAIQSAEQEAVISFLQRDQQALQSAARAGLAAVAASGERITRQRVAQRSGLTLKQLRHADIEPEILAATQAQGLPPGRGRPAKDALLLRALQAVREENAALRLILDELQVRVAALEGPHEKSP